jgi:hypothetical protein
LSVGATLTSLVLGLLAIVYSFLSSGQQNETLGAVKAASTSTTSSVAKLDSFMTNAEALQQAAIQRSSDLHTLTASMAATLSELRKETANLRETNQEFAGRVGSDLVAIRGALESTAKESGSSHQSPVVVPLAASEDTWLDDEIARFLSRSSIYGLAMIESVVLCHEKGKDLSLKELSEAFGEKEWDYLWGYLVALSAIGLIDCAVREEQRDQYSIVAIPPNLRAALNEEWKRREDAAEDADEKARNAQYRGWALSGVVEPPKPSAAKPASTDFASLPPSSAEPKPSKP